MKDVVLAYYDLSQKKYIEFTSYGIVEMLSLQGNLTERNGNPFWHIHAVIGDRNGNVRGGHLVSLAVALTLECWIQTSAISVNREFDEQLGLHLLNL